MRKKSTRWSYRARVTTTKRPSVAKWLALEVFDVGLSRPGPPTGAGQSFSHWPDTALQVELKQPVGTVHVTAESPTHTPAWHVSSSVQLLLSEQLAPSCLGTQPLVGSHSWHSSHVTGEPPEHTLFVHVVPVVQGLLSSQASPSLRAWHGSVGTQISRDQVFGESNESFTPQRYPLENMPGVSVAKILESY